MGELARPIEVSSIEPPADRQSSPIFLAGGPVSFVPAPAQLGGSGIGDVVRGPRFFYRKNKFVQEKVVAGQLYDAYSELNDFYKAQGLSLILPELALKIDALKGFINEKTLNYYFRSGQNSALSEYFSFDLSVIPIEYQKYYDTIAMVKDLTIKNKDVFRYLNAPSYGYATHPVFCEMVKTLFIK